MNYSIRMDRAKPSAIRSVQKRIASKPGVISFAAGLPDPALFPMEDLKKATMEMMERRGEQALQYGLSKGNPELLKLLVERMQKKEGVDTSVENIVITTGSQQGLAITAMLFLDEGDIVVAENPSYLGGINACRPYGCSFLGVDTDEDGIVIEDLERVLSENPKVKMLYVIPNFQNPTGRAWTLERRKHFMEVINRYDVVVVEDNPYGEIRFKGEHIPCLKSMDTLGKVIYLGSCSKILCPGLRVAWVCASAEYAQMYERMKESLDLQCNEFAQLQVVEYMRNYDVEAHILKIQAAYQKKCDLMLSKMEETFPSTVKFTRPEGGMFIWVELPEGLDADAILDEAIDIGVAYIPGEFFYANEGAKNTIRLNFTTVSEEQIEKGIALLAEVFCKYA